MRLLLFLSGIVLFLFGCAGQKEPLLDKKIGQMLMVGFRGADVNDNSQIVSDIKKYNLGGVVLFDYDVVTKTSGRNIQSPKQLKKLTQKLYAADRKLLIAVDQEGGRVARLKASNGFEDTPSAQELGEKNDLKLTRKTAEKIAQNLADCGINMNLAPVVDLNINPNNPVIGGKQRSFSANPDIAASHAKEFIKAHKKLGIICAVKHFPGHGSSVADSHLGLVDVTGTWKNDELTPYRLLIKENSVDCVMTAHIFNKNLDADYPATLSEKSIGGILRNELGFNGVVISDDMQMKAIADNYSLEESIEKSINAGADIILFSNNISYDPDIAQKAYMIIKKLVTDGRISQERIEESYRRIQKIKMILGSDYKIRLPVYIRRY